MIPDRVLRIVGKDQSGRRIDIKRAVDILIEEGFTCDSSIFPTVHDRYGLREAPLEPHRIRRPAGSLWEFPLPVFCWLGHPWPIGGGGYLRLYPYALTRHGLQSINAEGRPFAVYVHPWELDPDQPRPVMPWRHRVRLYIGLGREERKLSRLLRDFEFTTARNVLGI